MRLARLVCSISAVLSSCGGKPAPQPRAAPAAAPAPEAQDAGFGEVTWAARRYGTPGYEELVAVAAAEDGGYFAAGWIRSVRADAPIAQRDAWVMRLDREGRVLWQKAYGGDATIDPSAVAATNDGGCVVAGTQSTVGSAGWVLRLDASGEIVWERLIAPPRARGTSFELEGFVLATDVVAGAEGGVVVAGVGRGYWVVRLDAGGAPVWARSYTDRGRPERAALAATSDGGAVLAGTGPYGSVALRLASNGAVAWQRRLPEGTSTWDVTAAADGTYVVAGAVETVGEEEGTAAGVDVWLLTLDDEGASRGALAFDAGANEVALTVEDLPGVGLVVGGSYRADPEPATDALLLAFTPDRELAWQLRFGASRYWEEVRALAAHPLGGVVAVGNQGVDALVLDVGATGELESAAVVGLDGRVRVLEQALRPAGLRPFAWRPVLTQGSSAAVDTSAEPTMAAER